MRPFGFGAAAQIDERQHGDRADVSGRFERAGAGAAVPQRAKCTGGRKRQNRHGQRKFDRADALPALLSVEPGQQQRDEHAAQQDMEQRRRGRNVTGRVTSLRCFSCSSTDRTSDKAKKPATSYVTAMATAAQLIGLWERLRHVPGRAWWFSRIVGLAIPYTGSMRATVLELRPGYARVELREHRRVRNHLNSIHAIALTNLGEFTGGLAMTAACDEHTRSILLRLEVDFLKKARSVVHAECECSIPVIAEAIDHVVTTTIKDTQHNDVARVRATWRISRIQPATPTTTPKAC